MGDKSTIKQILQEGDQAKITNIRVFDFDGTLVNTPMFDTHKDVYLQKTGQPWPHKGWWGKADSLDMKIFDMPVFPDVISDYERERATPNTLMVMLTGRIPMLSKQVEAILADKGLAFDRYIYNNGGSTITSKIASLDALMKEFPNVTSVAMWEDREEHINPFKAWGAAHDGLDFNITLVNSGHHNITP